MILKIVDLEHKSASKPRSEIKFEFRFQVIVEVVLLLFL